MTSILRPCATVANVHRSKQNGKASPMLRVFPSSRTQPGADLRIVYAITSSLEARA